MSNESNNVSSESTIMDENQLTCAGKFFSVVFVVCIEMYFTCDALNDCYFLLQMWRSIYCFGKNSNPTLARYTTNKKNKVCYVRKLYDLFFKMISILHCNNCFISHFSDRSFYCDGRRNRQFSTTIALGRICLEPDR